MPVVSTVSLASFNTYCVQHGAPHAFYRLPGQADTHIVAQKTTGLKKLRFGPKTLAAKGFVFAPFADDKEFAKVLIAPDVVCTQSTLPVLDFIKADAKPAKKQAKAKLKEAGKKQYENLVRKIKKEIAQKGFTKIIAARLLKTKKPLGFEPATLFERLCKAYPNAFVSLVYTAQYGLWVGASPEILLTATRDSFTTYALAGTKANTPQNAKQNWGTKELEEHEIVSRYIKQCLGKIAQQPPKVNGPETVAAGNLLHLRTTFTYNKVSNSLWQKAVAALHPTPAVAGLPKKGAIQFIQKHEASKRSFYSGYLGPVNLHGQINLYVNLRCMQVLKNKLAIYVGCGITADSDPKAEWKESEIKSQTLLSVLKH